MMDIYMILILDPDAYMHVSMMHIYMTLDPNACMYDAHMYITLDPDACMCEAGMNDACIHDP